MRRLRLLIQAFLTCRRDHRQFNQGRIAYPSDLTKFWTLYQLRRLTHSQVLIESGTFHGATASRCAPFFDRVYTMELNPRLAAAAKQFLVSWPNVEVLKGDAVKLLPKLLTRPEVCQAVVFLDGHYSGPGTARGKIPEPAIEELKILAPFVDKLNAIVIDDVRCFGTEKGFPTLDELLHVSRDLFHGKPFDLQIAFDQLILVRRRGTP